MIPKIRKILYTTDLSENSAYAFRYAVKMAEAYDAQITIIYILEKPRFEGEPDSLEDVNKMFADKKTAQLKRIKTRVEAVIQRELKDKPDSQKRIAKIEILEGHPAAAILQKADKMKADILIMGTHGKGLIAHAFLGSVASQVLQRIRIPVFIIPIPKETDITFND